MKTHSTAGDDCLEDHPHHMLAVWMTGRCQRTNASQLENIETFQLTKIKLTFWTQSPNSLFSQKCVELWPGRRIRGLLVININFIFIVLQRGTGLNSLLDFAGAAAVELWRKSFAWFEWESLQFWIFDYYYYYATGLFSFSEAILGLSGGGCSIWPVALSVAMRSATNNARSIFAGLHCTCTNPEWFNF